MLQVAAKVILNNTVSPKELVLLICSAPKLWTYVNLLCATRIDANKLALHIALACSGLVVSQSLYTLWRSPAQKLVQMRFESVARSAKLLVPLDAPRRALVELARRRFHGDSSLDKWARCYRYRVGADCIRELQTELCSARNFNGLTFSGSLHKDDFERPVLFPCGCALDECDIVYLARYRTGNLFRCFLCGDVTRMNVTRDSLVFDPRPTLNMALVIQAMIPASAYELDYERFVDTFVQTLGSNSRVWPDNSDSERDESEQDESEQDDSDERLFFARSVLNSVPNLVLNFDDSDEYVPNLDDSDEEADEEVPDLVLNLDHEEVPDLVLNPDHEEVPDFGEALEHKLAPTFAGLTADKYFLNKH